ncbi:MAG TPA: hypothetical protein VFL66_02965 [Gaiellaceae bacterium]|nr:hypothetical protein [Gaiellaceae bacterium]
MRLAAGLLLALASTAAINWGWVAQHGAAGALPPLSPRRPIRSLRLLFCDLRWLAGFGAGLGGWAIYVAALRLAPLSLVQAVSAGGIALIAVLARVRGRREAAAVALGVAGLALLGLSLAGGGPAAGRLGAWTDAGTWLGCSAAAAALLAGPGSRLLAPGAGLGLAAGVLYAAGDVSTKFAVAGGTRAALAPAVLAAHGLAFVCVQLAFQRGGALATAGSASLLTNALPIAAGIVLFGERVPGGAAGAARVAAFACVVASAFLLARKDEETESASFPCDTVSQGRKVPVHAVE